MTHLITVDFEGRFLSELEQVGRDLRDEFPGVVVRVRSMPSGSLTNEHGHTLFIECLLPNVGPTEVDHVALEIGIDHVSTEPRLAFADVCWGHPSGAIEQELNVRGLSYAEEGLDMIEAGLPLLVQALGEAIRRGRPPG